MARKRLFHVGSILFAQNTIGIPLQLPSDFLISRIHCFLSGTRTTTGYTADGSVVAAAQDNPLELLRHVALRADGDTLQNWDGRGYYAFDRFMHGSAGAKVGIALTGAAVTAQVFTAHFTIDLRQRRSIFPIDTALNPLTFHDGAPLKNLVLEAEWGNYDDLNSGYTLTTVAVDAVTALFVAIEGSLSDKLKQHRFSKSRRSFVEEVFTTSANYQYRLPPSSHLLRALMLRTIISNATTKLPNNSWTATTGYHTLQASTDFWLNRLLDAQLVNIQKGDFGLDTEVTGAQAITGYRMLDFAENGRIERLAPRQETMNVFQYQADLTTGAGSNVIRYYRDEIEPLQKVQ